METMKRIYKMHDMIVWEDENDKCNSCYIYSISEYDWIAVEAMDRKDNEIGNFTSKAKAFKALQSHMEKLGYTIKL